LKHFFDGFCRRIAVDVNEDSALEKVEFFDLPFGLFRALFDLSTCLRRANRSLLSLTVGCKKLVMIREVLIASSFRYCDCSRFPLTVPAPWNDVLTSVNSASMCSISSS
jgi:hypothetical protein